MLSNYNYKKYIAAILLISLLCWAAPKPTRADTWGANMMAAIWKQTMEEMYLKIKEMIIATLKMQAIRIVQARMMSLLGSAGGGFGMGGGGLVISDWRQFIYGSAGQYSTQVTNDFFQNMRSSTPQPLTQRIIEPAEKAVQTDIFAIKPDLQNYVQEGRADKIFTPGYASNPWEAWRRAAMPQNDLAFMYFRGIALQSESFRQKEEEQKFKGTAGQGYKSVTASSGKQVTVPPGSDYKGAEKIVTPGSTIKDLVSKVLGMPIDMVALSRSIPEIVAAMVTQMLTNMINQGLVNISSRLGL